MSVSQFLLVMLGAAAGGLVIFIAFICVYLWHAIPNTPNFELLDYHTWYYFTSQPDQGIWAISTALYALFACLLFLILTLVVMGVVLVRVSRREQEDKRRQYDLLKREIADKQNLILAQIQQLNAAEMRDQTAAAKDNAIACAYQQLELALSKANSVDEINAALKMTVQLLNHLSNDANANPITANEA